jgi:hypothetical protein
VIPTLKSHPVRKRVRVEVIRKGGVPLTPGVPVIDNLNIGEVRLHIKNMLCRFQERGHVLKWRVSSLTKKKCQSIVIKTMAAIAAGVGAMLCISSSVAAMMMGGDDDKKKKVTGPSAADPPGPPSCRILIKRTHDSDGSYRTINEWLPHDGQKTKEACDARAVNLTGHGAISAFTPNDPPICWSKIANVNSLDGRYSSTEIGEWTPDYDGGAYSSESTCNQRQSDLASFGGQTQFQLEKPV